MKHFFLAIPRAIASSFAWLFDRAYGLFLAVVRMFTLARESRATIALFRASVRVVRVAVLVLLIGGTLLGGGWLLFERVPAGRVGVRQTNFGGAGLADRDLQSGLHFCVKGLHTLHLVDPGTQVLCFAWTSEGGEWPALDVRTRDGNMANVSIAIPFHIRKGEAHELVAEGLKSAYRQRAKATAEKILLEELGALSSGEMASTELRDARTQSALVRINERLAEVHLEAEAVLVTQMLFGGGYETKLQEQQLTAQNALFHKSATADTEIKMQVDLYNQDIQSSVRNLLADEDQAIEKTYVEGKQRIATIQNEMRYYDKTRRAQALAESDKLVAEGEHEITKAEALKEELVNRTYGTAGGKLMLARQAAENLNIHQVTLNSNDPRVPSMLDLDDMVKRLVGNAPPIAP